MSYSVAQRRGEIRIGMALGAEDRCTQTNHRPRTEICPGIPPWSRFDRSNYPTIPFNRIGSAAGVKRPGC
jgi:hypothetical protein